MYYLLSGSVCIAAVFNAKEDSLKLKLLATGLAPNVVRCVGDSEKISQVETERRGGESW